MSRMCFICGKKTLRGRRVTFSGKRNKRLFKPNLAYHWIGEAGRKVRELVCAKCWKKMRKEENRVKEATTPVIA